MGRSRLAQRNDCTPEEDPPYRALLRAAQWAAYFRRFYGGAWATDEIPRAFAPVTYSEATGMLEVADEALKTTDAAVRAGQLSRRANDPQQDPLGRTVTQMLLAGYRPGEASNAGFQKVVCSAAGIELGSNDAGGGIADRATARATHTLLQPVASEWPKESPFRRQVFSLEDELDREEGNQRNPVSVPMQIEHRGDAFSMKKTVYFRQPLSVELKALVNPLNWRRLGDYFAVTERGDRETTDVDREARAWQGILREKFVVTWNRNTTQVFDQLFQIDYTVSEDIARTDYFLMYEVDDQIALNEGYFEARKCAGSYSDWMSVSMVKTVKFTSSILNMLGPAVLAMFLDSKEGGFRAFARRESVGDADEPLFTPFRLSPREG